jgi:hypothetical protein
MTKRRNDHKNRILRSVSAKNIFLSPTLHLPTLRTHRAHFSFPIPFPRRCPPMSRKRALQLGLRWVVVWRPPTCSRRHLVRWARVAASYPSYGVRDEHQEGRSWTPGPAACTSLELILKSVKKSSNSSHLTYDLQTVMPLGLIHSKF